MIDAEMYLCKMRYRPLGKTGLRVSDISFGCASLSQDYGGKKAPSRKDAIKLLRLAWDAGINFFDVAPSYGNAEEILGEALGDTDAIFCTKFKYENIPPDVGDAVDRSLKALRRERLDVLLIHNQYRLRNDLRAAVECWSNKIKTWGLSVPDTAWRENGMELHLPVCQGPYNLLDTNMGCFGRDIAFIARQPYARGLLCNPPWNIGEQALRFCLSNKHISTVLVGMQTEEELEMNLRWAELGPLPLEPK